MSTHLIKHSFMSLTAAAVVALAMGAPARAPGRSTPGFSEAVAGSAPESLERAGAVIEALGTRDPAVAMSRLVAYEVNDVLLEGGAALHRAVWAAGVVDRVRLYVAPVVLGSTGVRWMPAGRFSFVALAGRRTRCLGEDVLLEADVQRFD